MTPGAYLALRRGAAGMTPADVDAQLGWEPDTMADIEERLRGASADLNAGASVDASTRKRVEVPAALMEALHGIFPFDPIIARRLGEGNSARVCTGCGCSERDPCWDEAKGACGWAGPALCTDCKDHGVIG